MMIKKRPYKPRQHDNRTLDKSGKKSIVRTY